MRIDRLIVVLLLTLPWAVLTTACDIPKDPEGSLREARERGVLRVGVSEDPPWTRISNGEVLGIEAEIVKRFARQIGVQVEWVPGAEGRLFAALEKFEIDLLIGGIDVKSPHMKTSGFTFAYLKPAVEVGTPSGSEPLGENIANTKIAVRPDDPVAALVRKEKAQVVVTRSRWSSGQAVAAYDFELKARGYHRGKKLSSEGHVLVVAPGENALLFQLERFLHARAAEIHDIAEQEALRE